MEKKSLFSLAAVFTAAFVFSACQAQSPAPEMEKKPAEMSPSSSPESMKKDMDGKEATHTANYTSPAGAEEVGFTIMVDKAGVITGATTNVLATAPISKMRQESFAKELPAAITGKKLSDLEKIDKVGGSSLTTNAFNDSLAKLKAQI